MIQQVQKHYRANKGQYLVAAVIFAGVLGAYLYFRNKKAKQGDGVLGTSLLGNTGVSAKTSSSSSSGSSTSKARNLPTSHAFFPLKNGSVGVEVVQLQRALLANGAKLPKYGVDGKFGSETAAALKSLYGLTEVKDASTLGFITNGMGYAG